MTEPGEGAGDLIVSGGGTSMVATDVVMAQIDVMRRVQADAAGWQGRLGRIRSLETTRASFWMPADTGMSLLHAAMSVEAIEIASGDLADKLSQAADAYGEAERIAVGFERAAGELGGWLVGWNLRVFGPIELLAAARLATQAGIALVGIVAVMSWATGKSPHRVLADLSDAVRLDPRLLTSTAFVAALRVVVSSLDDVGVGFLGGPPPVSHLLGEGGLGLLGVTGLASGARAFGYPLGVLGTTSVTVTQVGAGRPVSPPSGVEDAASRIPPARDHQPQVRIEQYGDPEHPTWAVYIAGTVDWSPAPQGEPWDLSSNVAAMAHENAGSYAAVMQAMRQAGIEPDAPVALFGHSQGGLVAEQVAASGAFNAGVVATFGAPESPVPIPEGVTHLTVEHTDDLVPALGGLPAVAAASVGRVLVRSEAFRDRVVPTDSSLPAHAMTSYVATARDIDLSSDSRLVAGRARLADMFGSAPGRVTAWRGERVTATAGE
ncbi:hypothetical protein GY21_03535 [Cryobacterium roopkundense]|uniref:DUF1023 domain-containing protein n=1 Tax=Cryobacterium roopkundense TaxID=1001240 RepID=A0A099JQR8_9MICO|nr:alpha/beta hydrolase [Cryobacterium roopkundense]KGJ79962.1 hypothetical protein GY21_03535 [Cryobacterium roopkundense]MBB5643106.1 hypothetical protein [Cryobacterium roopkundense]